MSEWISWGTCSVCGQAAAVGWVDGKPVEVDCRSGCVVTVDQLGGRPSIPGDGSHPRADRDEDLAHLTQRSEALCAQAAWLGDQAASVCERSLAVVAVNRLTLDLATRAQPLDELARPR